MTSKETNKTVGTQHSGGIEHTEPHLMDTSGRIEVYLYEWYKLFILKSAFDTVCVALAGLNVSL